MKTYIFYRESDDFSDILKDTNIKQYFKQKISWRYYLVLMSYNVKPEIESYIMLKYGDDIKTWDHIRRDNSPEPYIDYVPDPKRPEKFKNVYK